jgi:cytochrome c553
MKTHLKEKGVEGFSGVYNDLVNACNTCHKATGHGMVQVQVPAENRYTDQVFVP